MKILLQQFLSKNHSWSVVGQNISRSLIKKGNNVHLFSTNGLQYFPDDLKSNLIGFIDEETKQVVGRNPDNDYDCQISYTAMRNFSSYLCHGLKNRFGIWCYEWPYLPTGFAKNHNHLDYILAPSQFAKDGFINSGVPKDKVIVIPHGVDTERFKNKNKYPLKTRKKVIFFCNIGQAHLRKNIKGMFNAYMNAFNKNDDVCLVAKISKNQLTAQFEVDTIKIFNDIKGSIKNPPEVELITEYVPDIVELYNACNFVYTASFCEGFYLPGVEALIAGKINICPMYGGQLDFLNPSNSILINGKITRAPVDEQYWSKDSRNTHFEVDTNDVIDKLRYCYKNVDMLKEKLVIDASVAEKYSWDAVTTKILELTK